MAGAILQRKTGRFGLTLSNSDRTWGNGFKLKEGRLKLDVRKIFFTQRSVRPWHSCPEKLWCPIPGDAQGQVGWGPGQPELVWGSPAHGRGWGWVSFEVPSILWFYDIW